MSDKLSDNDLNDYIRQNDVYRGRYYSWKSLTYTHYLTVFGVIIAICSTNLPKSLSSGFSIFMFSLGLVAIGLSIFGCCLTIRNTRIFQSLFDNLGFSPTPRTYSDLGKEAERHMQTLGKFKSEKGKRLKNERNMRRSLIASFSIFAVIVFAPVMQLLL